MQKMRKTRRAEIGEGTKSGKSEDGREIPKELKKRLHMALYPTIR